VGVDSVALQRLPFTAALERNPLITVERGEQRALP